MEYHAYQELLLDIGEFKLDLHHTALQEAKTVVGKRIQECFRYNIRVLKIVYGTPPKFAWSIAKEIHRLVRNHESVADEMLPDYVSSDAEPKKINPELRVYLRSNPTPRPLNEDSSFQPFIPEYELETANLVRCQTTYMPLRRSHSLEWVARELKCTQEQLATIAKTPGIARLSHWPGLFTERAICLAYEMLSELRYANRRRKAKKRRKARDRQVLQHQVAIQPAEDPQVETAKSREDDILQRARQNLAEAKQFRLDSKYVIAERRLLAVTTATTDLPPEIIEDALLELGGVYIALNRREAEGILRDCLDRRNRRLGRGKHLYEIVVALAEFYFKTGDHDEYRKLVRDNADLQAELNPEERLPRILLHALIEYSAGNYPASLIALRHFSYAKGDTQISPGLDAQRYDLIGRNYSAQKDLFLAELAFKCALRCCESDPKACEDIRARIRFHQGFVCRRTGHPADALSAYREFVEYLRRQERTDSPSYTAAITSMGVAYRQLGNLTDAEKCYAEAAEIYGRNGQADTPEYATLLMDLATLRIDQAKCDGVEKLLTEAKYIFELKSSRDIDKLVTIQMIWGSLYSRMGNMELGQIKVEDAVELAQAELGADSARTAAAKELLGDCFRGKGELPRAAELYRQALDVVEREGPDSIHSTATRQKLRAMLEQIGRRGDKGSQ